MKDPARDTFKAIFFSGLLCMIFYFLIPFSFQGVFGAAGMLEPGIVDGTGSLQPSARWSATRTS